MKEGVFLLCAAAFFLPFVCGYLIDLKSRRLSRKALEEVQPITLHEMSFNRDDIHAVVDHHNNQTKALLSK